MQKKLSHTFEHVPLSQASLSDHKLYKSQRHYLKGISAASKKLCEYKLLSTRPCGIFTLDRLSMDELYDASKVILSLEGCVFGPEIRSIFRPREDLALQGVEQQPRRHKCLLLLFA